MTTKPKPPALIGGPYSPPRNARIGVVHVCEVNSERLIVGFSDAPIQWPRGRPLAGKGAPALIVCGGLAEAVRTESRAAVAHWWGVSPATVSAWRRALGVDRQTAGTTARMSAASQRITADEARERGRKGGLAGKGKPKGAKDV